MSNDRIVTTCAWAELKAANAAWSDATNGETRLEHQGQFVLSFDEMDSELMPAMLAIRQQASGGVPNPDDVVSLAVSRDAALDLIEGCRVVLDRNVFRPRRASVAADPALIERGWRALRSAAGLDPRPHPIVQWIGRDLKVVGVIDPWATDGRRPAQPMEGHSVAEMNVVTAAPDEVFESPLRDGTPFTRQFRRGGWVVVEYLAKPLPSLRGS